MDGGVVSIRPSLRSELLDHQRQILSECIRGSVGVELGAFAFAYFFGEVLQRGEDAEISFHGLEVIEAGVGDVVTECAEHGFLRKFNEGLVVQQARGVEAREQARGDVAHVTFHTSDLPCEEQIVTGDVLEGGAQKFG